MAREHYASAVVLTDWGAKTEGLSASRDALLQELLLLSLVYDQLLIQGGLRSLARALQVSALGRPPESTPVAWPPGELDADGSGAGGGATAA